MIDKISEESKLQESIYLLNAMVFDSWWSKPFEEYSISAEDFINYDSSRTTVNMMNSNEITYFSGEDVTGFGKEYRKGRYSFVALLPDDGIDVYSYINTMNGETWTKLWDNKLKESVSIKIPEFKYEYSIILDSALSNLGIKSLFNENMDLSGISNNGIGGQASSTHKTFIEFTRSGTKAAAATDFGTTGGTLIQEIQHEVILNRPFIYAIVDNDSGLPLFIGVVTKL